MQVGWFRVPMKSLLRNFACTDLSKFKGSRQISASESSLLELNTAFCAAATAATLPSKKRLTI